MSILLCAATPFEIAPTTTFLQDGYTGEVEIVITGVGLTATSYALTRAICTRKPNLLIQAGIAGSFDTARSLGTVVAVQTECIGDLGVEEEGKFRSVFDMKLANSNAFPWQDGKLSNNSPIIDSLGLPKVHAVTVNEISTNPERISYYAKTTGASVESMEGAAFHYVALMEKIPFVQLRSLSNFAGERNKENWRMEDAITSLNEILKSLIVKLNRA